MPLPLGHACQRARGIPGRLVRAVRSDGVVHIADRTHASQQADLFARQPVRVAGAVDLFMVMQADVQHRVGYRGQRGEQHGVAALGVAAHDGVLVFAQLARLVEHIQRHGHLADVVQQPGHAGFLHLVLGQAELAGERDHQCAHRHRVHVSVFVLGLQPRQAEQRRAVARQGRGDLLHQGLALLRIDGFAQTSLVEHRGHLLLGALEQPARALQLVIHAALLRRGGGVRRQAGGLRWLHQRWRIGGGRRCRFDIHALLHVDPQRLDATAAQRLQVGGIGQQELAAPERMVEPAALQSVYVHAEAKLTDKDFSEQGAPRFVSGAGSRASVPCSPLQELPTVDV